MEMNEKYVLQTNGEETLIALKDSDEILYSLDEVGAFIVKEICTNNSSTGEIITALAKYYQVSVNEVMEDVTSFVKELKEMGIVK